MFLQLVDIIALAYWALLTTLRVPRVTAFLRCLVYPFVQFQDTIQGYQLYLVDYINWGPQVWLLEQMLNAKFNPGATTYFITIGPGTRPQQTYLYYRSDNIPLYLYQRSDNKPVYLLQRADFTTGGYDFTVNIPHQLHIGATDPRIIQQLQRYKLAGKQYKIIIT